MKYEFWLYQIPFLSNQKKIALLKCGIGLEEIYRMEKKELEQLKILTQKEMERLVEHKKGCTIDNEWEELYKKGIHFTYYGKKDYPLRLTDIPNPPYGLTYYGELPKTDEMTVSVIGARNCSAYGAFVVRKFTQGLARNGVGVVSGMALGIDGIGQKMAIDSGGKSYAVLGCGVDVCYPKQNRELYEALKGKGAILSEYPLKTEPKPYLFPPRNRIISGLSDVLLVIEAKQKSGTLITVDMALEQGKEVYIIPGRITDALSTGCNQLVRQGAAIVCSLEEFLEEITKQKQAGNRNGKNEIGLDTKEEIVFRAVDFIPRTAEQIYEIIVAGKRHSMSIQEILQILTTLEIKGVMKRQNGCYYLSIDSDLKSVYS